MAADQFARRVMASRQVMLGRGDASIKIDFRHGIDGPQWPHQTIIFAVALE
jgi:hypothetical protein